jgi:hypothetical protein
LAVISARRGDVAQVLAFAGEAMDAHERTDSGVIRRKLGELRPHLAPLLGDRRIRELSMQISGHIANC